MHGSNFSVAHGGGNYISRHNNTSKNNEYLDVPQRQRKLTSFSPSSVVETLKQKVVKVNSFFLFFWLNKRLPLSTADHAARLFRNE